MSLIIGTLEVTTQFCPGGTPTLALSKLSQLMEIPTDELSNLIGDSPFSKCENILESQIPVQFDLVDYEDGLLLVVDHPYLGEQAHGDDEKPSFEILVSDNGEFHIPPGNTTGGQVALGFLYFLLLQDPRIQHQNRMLAFSRLFLSLFCPSKIETPITLKKIILLSKNLGQKKEATANKSDSSNYTRSQIASSDDSPILRNPQDLSKEFDRIRREKTVADFLVYGFSDGTAIPLSEIPWHPYGFLLRGDLYPSAYKATAGKHKQVDWSDHAAIEETPWMYSRLADKYFSQVIGDYQKKSPKSFGLFMAPYMPSWTELEMDQALPVESIQHLQEKIDSISARLPNIGEESLRGIVTLTCKKEQFGFKKPLNFGRSTYDIDEKILYFYPSASLQENLRKQFHKINGLKVFETENQYDIQIENHPDLETIKAIQESLGVEPVGIPKAPRKPKAVQARFFAQSANRKTVGVSFSAPLQGWNAELKVLHKTIAAYGSSLAHGIRSLWGMEAKELASPKRSLRAKELKLYKHAGLALLIIVETLNHLKRKSIETESVSDEQFAEDLSKKLAQFIYYVLEKETNLSLTRLEDLENSHISLSLIAKLKIFSSSLLEVVQNEHPLTMYFDGTIYELDGSKEIQNVMDFISQSLIKNKGGERSFLKNQFRGFEVRLPHSRQSQKYGYSQARESGGVVFDPDSHMIFELSDDAFPADFIPYGALSVDGNNIESLSPSDFSAQMNISSYTQGEIDWFSLNPKYFFKGKEISAKMSDQLNRKEVIEHEGRFYSISLTELPDIQWLEKFWTRIQGHQDQSDLMKNESFELKFDRSKILDLLALKRQGVQVNGDKRWNEISKNFDLLDYSENEDAAKLAKLRESLDATLRDFQKEGVTWMYRLHKLGLGGILADDMGLGKTVQSIALVHALEAQDQMGHTLIVVPTSLVFNWKNELQRFAEKLDVHVFHNATEKALEPFLKKSDTDKKGKILICTYGLMAEHIETLKSVQWRTAFFDEAQYLKNRATKRYKAAQSLVTGTRFALTGTPMENHYGEFFAIVDLVLPGSLGDYKKFISLYGKKKMLDDGQKNMADDLQFLKLKVQPLVLRRTKKEVLLELPEKTESVMPIEFDEEQKEIYKGIAISWNDKIKEKIQDTGEASAQLEMLTALLRLRQICSCPQGVPNITYNAVPPKIQLFFDTLEELIENNKSVVVFTNFLFTLDYVSSALRNMGIPVSTISGKDSGKLRGQRLEKFSQSDKAGVLAMTLKTGGVGLNLTKASYVFHLEPWWNPSAENQATDRVHRIGQTENVQVYRYIMKDSVEEHIQKLKRQKGMAFDALFGDSENTEANAASFKSNSISQKDFENLLHLS